MSKILIVDDDLAILDVVGLILENEGYEVDLLSEGKEIFEHIQHFHPDLILLDIMLGDVDGRDLCTKIKSTEELAHIPIIMISATHGMQEILTASCAPDDFIQKPFDIDTLIGTVQLRLSA